MSNTTLGTTAPGANLAGDQWTDPGTGERVPPGVEGPEIAPMREWLEEVITELEQSLHD